MPQVETALQEQFIVAALQTSTAILSGSKSVVQIPF